MRGLLNGVFKAEVFSRTGKLIATGTLSTKYLVENSLTQHATLIINADIITLNGHKTFQIKNEMLQAIEKVIQHINNTNNEKSKIDNVEYAIAYPFLMIKTNNYCVSLKVLQNS